MKSQINPNATLSQFGPIFNQPYKFILIVQVNLFQKHLFLHQLSHNMTTDCSWNYHENYKRKHGHNMFCACSFHGNSMNNLLSYCGLMDAKIRASDKDLPVPFKLLSLFYYFTINFLQQWLASMVWLFIVMQLWKIVNWICLSLVWLPKILW